MYQEIYKFKKLILTLLESTNCEYDGLFTWSGPKNSRNIREKYAKNLRNIREKYAKNLRKICEKIAKKSQKIKIREKFVKKS